MPFGAQVEAGQPTAFRLWAPAASDVELVLDPTHDATRLPMDRDDGGWHRRFVADAGAGTHYAFRIDRDLTVPDPATRANPDGVHAASAVVDPAAYSWGDRQWRGRPWAEAVIYELHVGTFTRDGTFAGAATRLDYLADLGVTAVELMPVAAFPGTRNWGYDGVLPFAPAAAYGTPDDLKRLVDAAHQRNVMVLLDVVYNHFGPEGNYLHAYAPQFFNSRHRTPWGAAINFDGEGSRTVREFFIHNALYWLHEFHFDGLRIDAVHAIADDSRPDFVTELAMRVRESVDPDRHVHLVLENDRNQASYLRRDARGSVVLASAQWNDDLHHSLHVIATGEGDGYYADYAAHPLAMLGQSLAEGFVFQGQPSPYRRGIPRGEPSTGLPPSAFVSFAQNHDQVGNRALGERLATLANAEALRALTACVLLSPQVPLLFMGEEYGAATPFLFFCDFDADLARAVTQGRRGEFARFARFRDPLAREAIPDPNAEATFMSSKLDWGRASDAAGSAWVEFYRRCLDARRRYVVPLVPLLTSAGSARVADETLLMVVWRATDQRTLHLTANLGARVSAPIAIEPGELAFATPGMPGPGAYAPLPGYGVSLSVTR
jgi:maltooligosyltrehalose trehalohydrolase